jgi:hypothetical protein
MNTGGAMLGVKLSKMVKKLLSGDTVRIVANDGCMRAVLLAHNYQFTRNCPAKLTYTTC